MEQRTPEWYAARCGKVTASRVADVIAKTKTGYGASRLNYMAELIAERMTGKPAEGFTNAAMQWGTDHESEAVNVYQLRFLNRVDSIGFVCHPTVRMSGASPDGLISDSGLIEIKCPNTATHIETLLSQTIPSKYVSQMQWQMACTGREWCDYVSYDPRMPEKLQLFTKRLKRSGETITELELEITKFLDELDSKLFALSLLLEEKAA